MAYRLSRSPLKVSALGRERWSTAFVMTTTNMRPRGGDNGRLERRFPHCNWLQVIALRPSIFLQSQSGRQVEHRMNHEQDAPRGCGRLRHNNRPGNPHSAPRCGARNRRGSPCQAPAMRGRTRCRLHGGKSPGPTTLEGLTRLRAARTTGRFSAEGRALETGARAPGRGPRRASSGAGGHGGFTAPGRGRCASYSRPEGIGIPLSVIRYLKPPNPTA